MSGRSVLTDGEMARICALNGMECYRNKDPDSTKPPYLATWSNDKRARWITNHWSVAELNEELGRTHGWAVLDAEFFEKQNLTKIRP